MPVVSNSDRKYKQRYFQCQERRRIEIEGGKTIASSAMEPLASGIHAVEITPTNPTTAAATTENRWLRVMARATRKPPMTGAA